MWHGYFGIENLGLTAAQRQTLANGLQTLGMADSDPQPAKRMRMRVRNDNGAVICEAVFDENDLTVDAFKTRLAAIFGVDPSTITHSLNPGVTPVITFFRPAGTERLRVALFGGIGASWDDSRTAAGSYLANNAAAWTPPE